jgi:acetyltransferase-like isoleucine patch superfamily enzyme
MKNLFALAITLLIIFLKVTPGSCQDVMTLKVKDRELARLINSCISKTDNLAKYCFFEQDKKFRTRYILKIMPDKNNDSIKISITPASLKYLLWPSSMVYGYYNKGGYPVFIIKDDMQLNDRRIFQKDPCFINEMVDSLLLMENDTIGWEVIISKPVYLFTFHRDLLKKKSGVINYDVYYPVALLDKKYWPVEFRDYLPHYKFSFEYEQRSAPWDWCPRTNFDGTFQTLTVEELDKMKHGSFYVDLRKRKQMIE